VLELAFARLDVPGRIRQYDVVGHAFALRRRTADPEELLDRDLELAVFDLVAGRAVEILGARKRSSASSRTHRAPDLVAESHTLCRKRRSLKKRLGYGGPVGYIANAGALAMLAGGNSDMHHPHRM